MSEPERADRRKAPRVTAAHPIILEWQTQEGELHRARGSTNDIALGGVYCTLERPLPLDTPVEFNIVLPGQLSGGSPLKLHCGGRVVRSEKSGERAFGVAVTIDDSEVLEVLEPTVDAGQHRVYARITPSSTLEAEYPGMRSAVRDLSLAGAFIEDDRPLPVGRVFKLRLSSSTLSAEIEVAVVVRRVEPQVGMAVEFIALSQEAKKALKEIVQAGRPWQGPQEVFPSQVWRSQGGEASSAIKLDDAIQFIRQRVTRTLPQLQVVDCRYRAGDKLFSLHLREPNSHAELLLPVSAQWVHECQVNNDCTQIDRAFGSASRILDLTPPPGLKKS